MPKVTTDFSKISSSSEPLPAGQYRGTLFEIEIGKNATSGLESWTFKTKVREPEEHIDREIWDFVMMETKEKKPNKMGLGRLKAYAEAIIGEEKANSSDGIDTDELLNGDIVVVTELETYMKKPEKGGGQGTRTNVVKILRPS